MEETHRAWDGSVIPTSPKEASQRSQLLSREHELVACPTFTQPSTVLSKQQLEVPALGRLRVRPLGQGSRLVTVEGLSVDGALSQD